MKTAAIIAEFNPYHRGHEYLVKEIKEKFHIDYIVAIMSGNFVQRGAPALTDKFTRAKCAVLSGVDAVFELPVLYATGAASDFAYGAVSLVNSMNICDFLAFGSESGNISELSELANRLANEPKSLKEAITSYLKEGMNYPEALRLATGSSLLDGANNTLALEYLKQLTVLNSSVRPLTVKRIGIGHNDKELFYDSESKNFYSSATCIRQLVYEKKDISNLVPLYKNSDYLTPMYSDDFSLYLSMVLESLPREKWQSLPSSNHELGTRIYERRNSFTSFSDFASLVTSKNFTNARVNRVLTQGILDLTYDISETDDIIKPLPSYLRLLAMKKSSGELIKSIKRNTNLPLITKMADYDFEGNRLLKMDIHAANIYNRVRALKYNLNFKSDVIISPEIV